MKQTRSSRSLVALAKVAGAAVLLTAGGQAMAGIASTKHNLGSTNNIPNANFATNTGEICVFCHTPHAANNTASAPAPLWNKALPSGTSYTVYNTSNSSTLDGEVLTTVGSVSLACLSCHDGSQAMDNMINAPGSGGYTAGGASQGYSWQGATQTGGILNAGIVTNIGKDLTNDHPIGIQYCGGGPNANTPGAACADADFVAPTSATINSTLVFWVDTGGGGRQKTDMVLYNRAFTGGSGPSVECGSCHDPHTSTNPTFLRISNTGSAVCLACHVK